MIHQISIHAISMHGLCLKFITLSCQLTFCQPSFPASLPIPPEKQKTPWNLWLCSTYIWPKRGTYQRGLLPKFTIWIPWGTLFLICIHEHITPPKKITKRTWKWWFGSDNLFFFQGGILRFQPLIFRGAVNQVLRFRNLPKRSPKRWIYRSGAPAAFFGGKIADFFPLPKWIQKQQVFLEGKLVGLKTNP